MLQISNLSTWIKRDNSSFCAVDNISFEIEPGEVLALIGESGSGKSMTALSIMRLLPQSAFFGPDSKICLYKKNLLEISEKEMRSVRGNDIGMIFQDPMSSLNPVLTIGAQISEVLAIHQKLKGRECYIEALKLLESVRIPAAVQRYKSYPHELSGGMKQRVMIAMALAGKPSLLIADEPTTALDVTTQAQILSLIKEIQQQQNMAMLLITHDLAVAAQMADKIAVMRHGRIVEQNSRERFFIAPKHEYSKHLLEFLPEIDKPQVGLSNKFTETVLVANNLKVYFPVKNGIFRKTVGYIKAVDEVSFALQEGETLALVGESGCGKTTIAKSVLALDEPAVGEVMYAGNNLLALKPDVLRSVRADIQIVFQDPFSALNPKLRIIDSLEEGMLALGKYPLAEQRMDVMDNLLTQVGLLPEHKWRYPHEFSGGERQRLCIARALTVEPKIIVCDEPTSSLDVSVQAQVLNLLKDLQIKHKLSYLFITHDFGVVSFLAHRVAVMYLGRIVESGLTTDILANPKHPYTQALLAAVPNINQTIKPIPDVIGGEMPSPLDPPSGCHFHPRCKYAKAACKKIYPAPIDISSTHMVKCVLYNQESKNAEN